MLTGNLAEDHGLGIAAGLPGDLARSVQTRLKDLGYYQGKVDGKFGRASVNFYAFNSNGNRGIACGLNNIQKLSDGTPLGGHSRAEDDFADLDDDDEDFLS